MKTIDLTRFFKLRSVYISTPDMDNNWCQVKYNKNYVTKASRHNFSINRLKDFPALKNRFEVLSDVIILTY